MLSTFRYLNTSVVAPSGAGALFVFSFLVVCSITDTWKTLVSAPGSWIIFVLLGQLMSAGSNCYAIALAFSELGTRFPPISPLAARQWSFQLCCFRASDGPRFWVGALLNLALMTSGSLPWEPWPRVEEVPPSTSGSCNMRDPVEGRIWL